MGPAQDRPPEPIPGLQGMIRGASVIPLVPTIDASVALATIGYVPSTAISAVWKARSTPAS